MAEETQFIDDPEDKSEVITLRFMHKSGEGILDSDMVSNQWETFYQKLKDFVELELSDDWEYEEE